MEQQDQARLNALTVQLRDKCNSIADLEYRLRQTRLRLEKAKVAQQKHAVATNAFYQDNHLHKQHLVSAGSIANMRSAQRYVDAVDTVVNGNSRYHAEEAIGTLKTAVDDTVNQLEQEVTTIRQQLNACSAQLGSLRSQINALC
jgi:DNA repair exonuclease SbcCD ATPase subunit